MKLKVFFCAILLTGLVFLAGCGEKQVKKIEIIGTIVSTEANNQCTGFGISTLAEELYFVDLNSEFSEKLAVGDSISVFGSVISEDNCKKIIPERTKILERKNTIIRGAVVTIDFTEQVKDGNIFETSIEETAKTIGITTAEPLKFVAGSGNYVDKSGKLLVEVAKAVIGMRKGEEKTLEIPPEKGFGVYDSKRIIKVSRDAWPLPRNIDPDIGVEVSGIFNTYAVVHGFDENFIYFDLNPKFAGKTLIFWLKVKDFNNETSEYYNSIVEEGDTVKVDYNGELLDGNVFDTTQGRKPFEFVVGSSQVIKGFNNAVLGMKIGEEKTVILTPDEAYGYIDEKLIIDVNKTPEFKNIKIGDKANGEVNGRQVIGRVISIDENTIKVDFNPELAGKVLKFSIALREIIKAK